MNTFLLNRESGESPRILRDAQITRLHYALSRDRRLVFPARHIAAVNFLSIEPFESRYLLSAGGESAIYVWDLETSSDQEIQNEAESTECKVVAEIPRGRGHKYGVSAAHWWPFDSGMFTSSSFDYTVKVWDTNSMTEAASFDVETNVYSHDMSPIASHCLIAVGANIPGIRLCDLKSGGFTHSLIGHHDKVIAVRWSPRMEYVLASGGSDGTIRLWDIRRAASCLAMLDMTNSASGKLASTNIGHNGAVNGLTWTDNGGFLLSTGNDDRMRLWEIEAGSNTLVNYGASIVNKSTQVVNPLVTCCVEGTDPIVFHPCDDGMVRGYDLFTGTPITTFRAAYAQRVTCIARRPGHIEYYTAGADRKIRLWSPYAQNQRATNEAKAKKEGVLSNIYRDLIDTQEQVRFT